MASVEIKVPTVGESINEATIGKWNFKSGDWVEKDSVVFEIETEKATMEVNAPASGKLSISKNQGEIVPIGSTVASLDTDAQRPAGATANLPPPPKTATNGAQVKSSPPLPPVPTSSGGGGLEIVGQNLKGMGPGMRKAVREGRASMPTSGSANPFIDPLSGDEERKPMSVIRKKIAERLIQSQQTTATLTTFNEVDMSNILNIRASLKDEFAKKYGVKLGFMSFFTRGIVFGASQVPIVNAFVDGTDVVYHKHVHTGIAVSTERGLIVPVLRFADKLSYGEIEKQIESLAARARAGQLGIEDMIGGTITVTNGGVFGSLLSTPILNPPQSAILGMHKTEQRPRAIEKDGKYTVEVRPMMYLALSYDHRLIDGKDSVTFLVKVKEYLESVTADEVLKG